MSCGALQPGQRLYRFASSLLGDAQFIKSLQIEPELRTCAEKVSKPQRCVTCHGSLTVQNFGDPICRNLNPSRKLRRANVERRQLLSKVFSRMNRRQVHS